MSKHSVSTSRGFRSRVAFFGTKAYYLSEDYSSETPEKMCGIAGVIRLEGRILDRDRAALARMLRAEAHRGPDGEGSFADGAVLLGHVRLAVIDRSAAGRQPMSNEDGDVWVSVNGEIYNFKSLRTELRALGHTFRSEADTEVLLHGYESWGIEGLLRRLRGMFAFALADVRRRDAPVVYLVRDRLGIKPLYYARDEHTLVFASELTSLVASGRVPAVPAAGALTAFLALGSLPGPETAVAGVEALAPAHYLELKGGRPSLHRYWQVPEPEAHGGASSVAELVEEAVRLHLVSDVPLGVFSSGGIDSAALVAVASEIVEAPLTTLSVVFDDPALSEARYAKAVAKRYKTAHREIRLDKDDFLGSLEDVFRAMDSPSVDGVNSFFVSRAARHAGLTVVLTGLGGDEIFLGYPHFKTLRAMSPYARWFGRMPPVVRRGIVSLGKVVLERLRGRAAEKLDYLEDARAASFYLLFRGLFTPRQISELVPGSVADPSGFLEELAGGDRGDLLSTAATLELAHYLPHQLLRDTDVMSMTHSLEARVPLLDHVLVEALWRRPHREKLSKRVPKPLLLEALRCPLPREVWDRPKQGFTLPFARWMRDAVGELRARTLGSGIFHEDAVHRLFQVFVEGRTHWSRPWALVVYGAWCERLRDMDARFRRGEPVAPVAEVGAVR